MAEDALTGLPDRRGFLLALRRLVGSANERQESLALMVVDVEGFAAINGIPPRPLSNWLWTNRISVANALDTNHERCFDPCSRAEWPDHTETYVHRKGANPCCTFLVVAQTPED